MKKLPIFLLICLLIGIVACKETEDYWTQYEQWRETNESWFIEQLGAKDEKGNPIYTKVVPSCDHSIYVLMKYYNDTSLNRDAQSPYQTSTINTVGSQIRRIERSSVIQQRNDLRLQCSSQTLCRRC